MIFAPIFPSRSYRWLTNGITPKWRKVAGPCSSLASGTLATAGRLMPDDLVGKNRKVRLVKAGTVKGLFKFPTA